MFVKLSCALLLLVTLANAEEYTNPVVRVAYRVFDECQRSDGGLTQCFKKKAITFIDRVSKVDNLPLGEGMKVIKTGDTTYKPVITDAELEKSLPRSLEERDGTLNDMLIERVVNFFNSRTMQVTLPKITSEEIGRGIEEGRGKMKKMMGTMMMGIAMKMAALVPIAIAALFLLAGKALIVSKIALLLAGIIALKKLLASKQGGGGHGGSGGGGGGWSSGGGGGWDRRSLEAQDLAYRGYNAEKPATA